MLDKKHAVCSGRLVIVGFGSIGQGVLPLLLRHLVIDPAWVSAPAAIGGYARLLVPAAVVVGTFVLGCYVFNREAPRIAEEL